MYNKLSAVAFTFYFFMLHSISGLLVPVEFRCRSVVLLLCPSVCSLVTSEHCAKTTDSIETPFEVVGHKRSEEIM